MNRFEIDCELTYQVAAPTHFIFQIEAARTDRQHVVSETLDVSPDIERRHYDDPQSCNRFFRFDAPTGPLRVHYRATVDSQPPIPDQSAAADLVTALPDDVVHYLMPTRYCESDLLGPAAQRIFGDGTAKGCVEAVCAWIREHIDYRIGMTTSTTTARDVFVMRSGVCRDFAHLGITFCRALNIPARFVVGYVKFDEPPPDFHALFEAWIGGRWVLFDPTGLAPTERLVRVATGRDAKDVAFATMFGPASMISMAPLIEPVITKIAA
ncbi:transglutaminase family protein [soil metagenome]